MRFLSELFFQPLLQERSHLLELRENQYLSVSFEELVQYPEKLLHLSGRFRPLERRVLLKLNRRIADLFELKESFE